MHNSNNLDVVHVLASQGLTPETLEEISLSTNEIHSGHDGEEFVEKVAHLIHEAEEGAITPEDSVEQKKSSMRMPTVMMNKVWKTSSKISYVK